jgi:hypothetical protein
VAAMRLPSFTFGVACFLMLLDGQAAAVRGITAEVVLFHLKLLLYALPYSLLLTFLLQLLYFLLAPSPSHFFRFFFISFQFFCSLFIHTYILRFPSLFIASFTFLPSFLYFFIFLNFR